MKKRNAIYFLSLLLFSACYYDNEDDLYDGLPCKTGEISYRQDIVPILSANCYSCHSISNAPIFGEGLVLEGYTNMVLYLQGNTETLIGAIEHNGNGVPMPQNSTKLSRCSIQAFKDWIDQGKNNN